MYRRKYLIYDPVCPWGEAEAELTLLRGLFSGEGTAELKRGDLFIQARVVNQTESRSLGAPLGTAVFQLDHIFYDFDDRSVSCRWFVSPVREYASRRASASESQRSSEGRT